MTVLYDPPMIGHQRGKVKLFGKISSGQVGSKNGDTHQINILIGYMMISHEIYEPIWVMGTCRGCNLHQLVDGLSVVIPI
jgi:hypothetical protein